MNAPLFTLTFFLTSVLFLFGCAGGRPTRSAHTKPVEVTVSTDPRIELLAAVQYLSDYKAPDGGSLLTKLDFEYKRKAAEYFAPYREHPAVLRFREMSIRGFSFGMPPEAMLSLTNPPRLEIIGPFREMVVQRAGGREELERFIADLRLFARDTKFTEFYRSQQSVYTEMVQTYRTKMRDFTTAADVEEYFGWSQAGYHIIIAPFFHPGGYGPRIHRAEGIFDVYNLCGPYRLTEGVPDFGSRDQIRYLVWHEFGHSFVNHLTDTHIDKLMIHCKALMPPIPEEALKRAGVDLSVAVSEWVSEHVIRSVTVRLAYLKLGVEAGDSALKNETGRGYPYVEQLCQSLTKYEQNRKTWPTFRDYYPEIVRLFEDAANAKLSGK